MNLSNFKKKIEFRVFLCFLFMIQDISADFFNNEDCLDYQAFEYFRYSPSYTYDPIIGIDGPTCSRICSEGSLPHAGVVGKKYCLCASEREYDKIKTIAKVTSELCDEGDMYLRYFQGKKQNKIQDLNIRPSKTQSFVDEEIHFNLISSSSGNVEYMVDFGDGSDLIQWSPSNMAKHQFDMSGTYTVTVYARLAENINEMAIDVVSVVIQSEIHSENVQMTCPSVVEPDDIVDCNITIIMGTQLQMKMEFGDGVSTGNMNLPDVPMKFIGISIPKSPNNEILFDPDTELKSYEMVIISIPKGSFTLLGAIMAIEGYGAKPGQMMVYVLRKQCFDKQDCAGTWFSCYEPNGLCSASRTCNNECQSFTQKRIKYNIVKKFELTIMEGQFYLTSRSSFRIFSDDLIALKMSSAQLSYRNVRADEKLDYKAEMSSDSITELDSDKMQPILDRKYYIRLLISEPLSFAMPHVYGNGGNYPIKLLLQNQFSEKKILKESYVNVQSTISKLKLMINPLNGAVSQKINITAQLNKGSNIKLVWKYGDGNETIDHIAMIRNSQKFSRIYQYHQPGVYKISVTAENLQGNTSAEQEVVIQHPVLKLWKITSDSPKLLPEPVKFTISYPEDSILPTNATLLMNFGDGKRHLWKIPDSDNEEWNGEYEVIQEYHSSGVYDIDIEISNVVSRMKKRFQVEVMKKITDLKLETKLINSSQSKFIESELSKFISVQSALNFNVTTRSGDVEYYLIYKNDELWKNTTDPIFNLTFDDLGLYNLNVFAYNHIQNLSKPFSQSIHVLEPVQGLDVRDFSNDTVEPEIKRFSVNIQTVGTNSCMLVDFNERIKPEDDYYTFGDSDVCSQLFPDLKTTSNRTLKNFMEISKYYSKPQNYLVTFILANLISRTKQEILVTVIEIDCRPPIIEIKNQITYWRNAVKAFPIWRSKPIQLYSKTLIDCNASFTATRYWTAFQVNEETGNVISEIDLSELDSYSKSFLYVPAFYLMAGLYRFYFNINLTSFYPHPLLPLQESSSTFVRVVPSPIIVRLTEGAQSRVVRGWGQKVNLSPRKHSIDLDNEKNKNFDIKWYCRRLPDEYINNLLPDERQNFSNPLFDRSSIDEGWNDEDGGGCFGQGPGRINITEDEIEWNTTVFRKPDTTYEMVTQIIPFDREPSWGALQLVLLKNQPPSVVVKCQTKELCYPHYPNGQKINPVRVGLEGSCIESCDGELVYQWKVYGITNTSEDHLSQANRYLVGIDQPKMALGVDFFKEFYPKYKDFSVRLTIITETNLIGESDLFLHINQPPEGGQCQIQQGKIKALIDKVNVRCSMWTDPEDRPIEYYAFWIRNLEDGILSYLMYGPDKQAKLVLPFGNFTVGVDIKDKEGATTRLEMANITTLLPTEDEYQKFMSMNVLDNTDASGDQALMSMMAQAMSSLLNINFGVKLKKTTTTTTTTTTTASYDYIDQDQLAKEAETKARIIKSVATMMNTDTLNSLEQIGSALTALAGKGKGIDIEAKELIIKLLNKTISIASKIQVESPQQLLDFCRFAVGTMGGIRMTEQIVSGIVLPSDKSRGWDLDYSVEVPDVDDEPDYIMDAKTSIEEALKKAVIRAERQAAELQIRQMIELTIKLVLTILKNIVVGEEPIEFCAPSGLTLTIAMYPKGSISNKVIKHGESIYVFPHVCDILVSQKCFGNETLGVLAVSWPSILESFGNSVDLLSSDSKTLQLLVINETLDILDVRNTTNPFSIIVPRNSAQDYDLDEVDLTYVVPKLKFYESMVYHQVMVEKADSAVNIEIKPTNNKSELLIYIKYREKPMFDYYDLLIPLKSIKTFNGDSYNIFLSNEIIHNKTGFFYIGVVEVDRNEVKNSSEAYILDKIIINKNDVNGTMNYTVTNYTVPGALRNFQTNYSMKIFTSGCYFYDYHQKIWSAKGCSVDSANYAMTHCKCNHLTSFGSGFFVMPNSIDFSYVFANAGFSDNVTIYMAIAITLILYALLLVWARDNDRKDELKLGTTPLPDNDLSSKYFYEILVYTGDKNEAGTDSKIQFVLSGDEEETGVRTLEDPFRKAFRRGETNSFLMAVPKKLGRLNFIRIWHDNSGQGIFKSWFLSFISIKDVQTNEKYEFICNKWFAVEKNDGLIDRLIPVASLEEATNFSHLFQQTTHKNMADGHLWFSIFMRPPRSRFTRVQRVSCCMALLYLSMLVNAMWYERVPSKPNTSALEFGPFSLSPEQIGVGFMSNLIVFPITFLIIICFRKARLKELRPSRITEALKKQKILVEKIRALTPSVKATDNSDNIYSNLNEKQQTNEKRIIKKNRKRFTLPHYFRYVGWALCFISISVAVFFLWAYGIQFGEEKTRKWITSLIVSFFASILVTQPIKVFLTAMILSTIFKSSNIDIDDSEEDEQDHDLSVIGLEDEEWLNESNFSTFRPRVYRFQNLTSFEKIKQLRLKEIKMVFILKDIFSYLCFLWLLTVISYGNRDPGAYLMKETLVKTLIENSNSDLQYDSIKSSTDMWKWVDKTLIPNLLIGQWYNGYMPLGLRGFMDDRVNRMMGYGILRQVRIKPNTCKPGYYLKKMIDRCRAFSNILHEDRMSYMPGWQSESIDSYVNESLPLSKNGYLNPSKSKKDEWNYRSAFELNGLSFLGKLDIYSGGGYVIALKGSREELRKKINKLVLQNWIDERTRAVFVEFSVYNAQANLFGIISCVLEFQPGGGIIPNFRVDVLRLMRYHQGFGLFVILCEISYVCFIIYFTIRETKLWLHQGRNYFKSYWNWAELLVIGFSYSAMMLYIYRIILTKQILRVFHETHGNGYVKLQYVSAVDEMFGYLLAFVMFVAILKFTKLLRFNKRIGVLYSTLGQCSKDLKSFSIVFCIVFFAFVQMFYLLFGLTMKEYSSFINAMESTFGMMTGKFDFNSMIIAAPVLGPIVFFIFVLCANIILVNIFLTLIISAFESVKHDVMKQNNEYEILDFIFKKFKIMLGLENFIIENEEKTDETTRQIKIIEEKIAVLPAKIDHLFNILNVKGKKNGKLINQTDVKKSNGVIFDVLMLEHANQSSHSTPDQNFQTGRNNRKRSQLVPKENIPKVTFFDWNEINH